MVLLGYGTGALCKSVLYLDQTLYTYTYRNKCLFILCHNLFETIVNC